MFKPLIHLGIYSGQAVVFMGKGMTDSLTLASLLTIGVSAAAAGWCLSREFWTKRDGDYASFATQWVAARPPSE